MTWDRWEEGFSRKLVPEWSGRGAVKTPRLSENKLALRRASWLVGQEESRNGLLIVSCQAVRTESRSMMTIGVEHFGQRKQEGWVGEEVVAADGCSGMGWSASRR